METLPVSAAKQAELERLMTELGIRETDLEETFVRSGGPGGQNVNKTATCVTLLHRPSGIMVKCQATRRQGLNRFIARQLLLAKLTALRRRRLDAERARVEKARRQNRPRSRRAKERMLASKALQAAKKQLRRRVEED